MVDLAREAFVTNNFELAAEMYEISIREKGPNSELFLGLADSFARGGQFAKAFDAYTNAYRYGKVTPEKLKHLVTGLINTVKQDNPTPKTKTQPKGGIFLCEMCRGLLSDPVTLPCGHTFCRKCFSNDKSETCVICDTVHYRLKIKKISSNVVLVNLIEKLFPNECTANRLKREGNQYFEKRDFKHAIRVYTEAIKIVSDDHLIFSNRCHAYASLDQFDEALADAERVLSMRPDWPKGYFRKGSALYGLGHYEDAVVAFLQCLALDPKVTSARDQLSRALDKILSALPPDDPKAQSRLQEASPSKLHQLIRQNFNSSLLLSTLSSTLSNVMNIVQDTLNAASNFSKEQLPAVSKQSREVKSNGNELEERELVVTNSLISTQKSRCNSLPDCSTVNHEDLHRSTLPRSYSPLPPSLTSRKRLRNPSSSQEPFSPTHNSPEKFPKPAFSTSANQSSSGMIQQKDSRVLSDTVQKNISSDSSSCAMAVKADLLSVEDLECSLCYRLFFEPVTTPCGHTFCRKCLDRCLDHTVACPMCKGNMAEYLAERRREVTEALQSVIETYFKQAYNERSEINDNEMGELARRGSDHQSEIPVFVCTIAFPTLTCPLHIFEPRYRLMVRQCMESGTRQFGMCLQSSDTNDNMFVDYGCMLEIRDVQYFPDGRSLVDTVGGRRFKVLHRGVRDGYNTAQVEYIQDTPLTEEDLPGLCTQQEEIHSMLKTWLDQLPTVQRGKIYQMYGELPPMELLSEPLPNGPRWCWWALAVLPFINPRVQLALLAMVCLKERFSALKKIMEHVLRQTKK